MNYSEQDVTRFKAKVFKALADPIRLRIIEFLHEGEKCVCEIFPFVGIPQPLASRHLKILKNCGLVRCRKEGNKRFYSITDPRIIKIIDSVTLDLKDSLSEIIVKHLI